LLLLTGYFLYRGQEKLRPSGGRAPLLIPTASTLVPRLHVLGGLKPSVAYIVETTEGLVLIDSGLQSGAKHFESQMAELGLHRHDLRAILLTHAHGDHSGGAESLRETTKAKVYAGAGDAAVLRAGEPREAFFSIFDMPDETLHPTTVDLELRGGESLAFGDVRFRALATPGHTPGSICYLMERAGLRVLFSGDVINMIRGRDDLPGGVGRSLGTYSTYLAPRYRGNARDYLASLRELRALPVPDLVLPGHLGDDPTPQSPALSQRRWEMLLDDGIREMETLVARYEADGAGFLDGVPKHLLPDLDYLGDFGGVAVYGFFAASRFFLVNAAGGPGLVEFVKTRLQQLGREPAGPTAVLLTGGVTGDQTGLTEIVRQWHAQVVAAPMAVRALEDFCPAGTVVVSAAELPAQGWFKVAPIPLREPGFASIAYQIELSGKTVLLTGRLPNILTAQSVAGLASNIGRSKADLRDYLASLSEIRRVVPKLWLPATPLNGQNANLYDSDWQRVIDENQKLTRFLLSNTKEN
jgi:glyoxylase-like metal-dependent hydrolase (beta-lactamase superfamily II)